MSTCHFARFIFAAAIGGAVLASAVSAPAQTFTVIQNFAGGTTQPSFPAGGQLVQGRDGNLYGESYYGGTSNTGTIFRATPKGTVTVVHDTEAGCGIRAITAGHDGNIYGACNSTDAQPNGYIWRLTLTGTFTDLHDFDGTDGANPLAPVLGTDGNLYGVTEAGGANSQGTFYKLVISTGTLTTLYTFGASNVGSNAGCFVQGTNGNFYCSTGSGGGSGNGTLFSLSTSGKLTLLHTFAGAPTDASGGAGMVQSPDGNFYGSTPYGGTSNQGTIFKMTPSGTVTLLHSFNGTTDGGYPAQGISLGSDDNLYGTANDCSGGGCGSNWTAFKVTRTGTFTVLETFTQGGADGWLPDASMVEFTNGLLYGVCEQGGTDGDGTLWTINEGLKPFLTLESTSGDVGSKVGILGQGFSASSVVKFNGVQATTVTLTGTTYLTATVPAGATDGFVTVTTGSTTLTSTQKYTVHNSWMSGKTMPTGTVFSSVGVLNGDLYVIGGDNASGTVLADVQIYNPTTNAWSTGTALPTATDSTSAAVVNNILYVFGGSTASAITNAVWAYSPKTKAWTSMAAMPTARNGTLAVVEKNIVYVIGGNTGGGGNFVATVESYDPATNTWTEETPMDGTKDFPGGGLIGTTVVVSGGANQPGSVTGDTEGYDATTNSWSELTADPTARTGPCSGAIEGTFYEASGYINNAGAATTVNESFNLTKNTWTTALLSIPQGTMFAAPAVADGQLYCFGGWASMNSTAIDNVQIYQP
jgi:uncharacterized repeat protein (TIGR03803 family)